MRVIVKQNIMKYTWNVIWVIISILLAGIMIALVYYGEKIVRNVSANWERIESVATDVMDINATLSEWELVE